MIKARPTSASEASGAIEDSLSKPEPAIPALEGKHIPALDGVRGFAALMVMLFHFCQGVTPMDSITKALIWLSGFGSLGVTLFFVLSGYLITGILCDTKESPHFFRNFYMRRALRIFPLYYLMPLLLYVLVWLVPSRNEMRPRHILWVLTYCQNFCTARRGFVLGGLNHYWTLAVEEQFYLVWPLAVWGLSRRGLLRCCGILTLLAPGLRWAAAVYGPTSTGFQALTPFHADALAMGGGLAVMARTYNPNKLVTAMQSIGPVTCIILFSGIISAKFITPLTFVISSSMWVLLFGVCVYLAANAQSTALGTFFGNSTLRLLGKYSYGLYIFHIPIFYGAIRYQGSLVQWLTYHLRFQWLALGVQAVVFGILSFLAAFLSYQCLEMPFLKLKQHFKYSRAGDATELSVPSRAQDGATVGSGRWERKPRSDARLF